MARYVGIDLHKNMFVGCFLESDGTTCEYKTYSWEKLKEFTRDLVKSDVVGVETTTNTRYFVKEIEPYVKEVKVVNPTQFKVIAKSVKKTDRFDAKTIAIFLSKGMLPEIRMKEEKYTEIQSLAQTRDKLVKLRTVLKNKIHNILLRYGYLTKRESYGSKNGLEKVLDYEVGDAARVELEVIVEQIRSLNESIQKLEKKLTDKGSKLKGFKNITSIKGIGDTSGSILLSIIGDINDFESEKKLAAYFGIVPKVEISNQKVHYGKITKLGSKLGRTTLVQCTLIAKRYSAYLNTFYEKIKAKRGGGRAIIATAKKLLGVIYNTLQNDWIWEDFSRGEIKTCPAIT